ncbi:MAG: hypothetical protein ACRD8U_05555 [Pyrinomonadaceae bacterium]
MMDSDWTLDNFGRFLAQLIAEAETDTGEPIEVSTHGVLANWIHVTTPDGTMFNIDIEVVNE